MNTNQYCICEDGPLDDQLGSDQGPMLCYFSHRYQRDGTVYRYAGLALTGSDLSQEEAEALSLTRSEEIYESSVPPAQDEKTAVSPAPGPVPPEHPPVAESHPSP